MRKGQPPKVWGPITAVRGKAVEVVLGKDKAVRLGKEGMGTAGAE